MVNLDTHILIAFLQAGLDAREREVMAKDEWAISDIVLWELAMLARRGRAELDFSSPEFRLLLSCLEVIPISLAIARMSTRLDFSSDPADEIIAATSIVERIPLLTRDRRILKSRMVPLAR
ncbi:MAG: type II toxin-antitoxin system VapC family toxin [Terriglobia bacterium]